MSNIIKFPSLPAKKDSWYKRLKKWWLDINSPENEIGVWGF